MTFLNPDILEEEACRIVHDRCFGFGSLSTPAGMLPLKELTVDGNISGGMFHHTRVRQVFRNVHNTPLEATYIFPLPPRAGVTACRMKVADRTIEAQLKERQAARQEYTQAIKTGHRAAIAEEERPDVFNLRLGNLMPGEEATIELDLVGALNWDENEAEYRFPLVVAPRYIPGKPLNLPAAGEGTAVDTDLTPDASRITPPMLLPGFPNPVQLDISVTLDAAGFELYDPQTSMPCSVEHTDNGKIRLRLKYQERLNRDFILRYKLGNPNAITTDLVMAPDPKGNDGTYCLTIVPDITDAATTPRDVILILDRSCSMGGWKMTAARRAAARLIDSLDSADRYHILAFDNVVEEAPGAEDGLITATDYHRFRGSEFLAGIEARGGTEMAGPLKQALKQIGGKRRGPSRQRAVVLITDGQVGNEDHLLRVVEKERGDARIYTVGIDRSVNAGFLERLANAGEGFCELVESEDRLDDVLDRIRRRLGQPSFQDAAIEALHGKLRSGSQAPARMGDAFPGRPWFVLGRYKKPRHDQKLELAFKANDGDGGHISLALTGRQVDAPHLAAVWAKTHLRDLEDRYAAGRENRKMLEKQIVDVSLQHHILCRFTAWLAVDQDEVVNEGGVVHQQTQAVEVPDGWEARACVAVFDSMPEVAGRGLFSKMRAPAPGKPAGKPGGAAPGGKRRQINPGDKVAFFKRAIGIPKKGKESDKQRRKRLRKEFRELDRVFRAAPSQDRLLSAFMSEYQRLVDLITDLTDDGLLANGSQLKKQLLHAFTNRKCELRQTLNTVMADLAQALDLPWENLKPAQSSKSNSRSFWK